MSLETDTIITYTLRCDHRQCETAYVVETDDESIEPYESAEEEGWFVREHLHLCPECAELGGLDGDDLKEWAVPDGKVVAK